MLLYSLRLIGSVRIQGSTKLYRYFELSLLGKTCGNSEESRRAHGTGSARLQTYQLTP